MPTGPSPLAPGFSPCCGVRRVIHHLAATGLPGRPGRSGCPTVPGKLSGLPGGQQGFHQAIQLLVQGSVVFPLLRPDLLYISPELVNPLALRPHLSPDNGQPCSHKPGLKPVREFRGKGRYGKRMNPRAILLSNRAACSAAAIPGRTERAYRPEQTDTLPGSFPAP